MSQQDDSSPNICLNLVSFADGELTPEEANEFRRHLRTCEECQRELTEAVALSARLSVAKPKEPWWRKVVGRIFKMSRFFRKKE